MTMSDTTVERNTDRQSSANQGVLHQGPTNVAGVERALSIAIGSLVVAKGISRFGLTGLILGGIGAALLNRGLSGHCSLYQKMGVNTAEGESH